MSLYSHILLATDFNEETKTVIQRAKSIAKSNECRLSVIHVIEPLSIAYGGEFPLDLGELHREIEKHAQMRLKELASQLDIPSSQCYLEIGITEKEILRIAKNNDFLEKIF